MRAAIASPLLPLPMQILSIVREQEDVFTWDLLPPAPFRFEAGQFNMVYAHGAGEVPISISGSPEEPGHVVHTIRAVGPVTQALAQQQSGDVALVRGPYGTAWPVAEVEGRDVLIVAGGLGLAPLRPAIRSVLSRRGAYGRVTVIVGARSPDLILFRDEVSRWRGRFDTDVQVIVDRAGRDWHGPVGVVTRLVGDVRLDAFGVAAFICGPEMMMRFVIRTLEERGVAPAQMWLSLERSMKCGVGLCGHCQLGPHFVCKDGPVYRADEILPLLYVKEL